MYWKWLTLYSYKKCNLNGCRKGGGGLTLSNNFHKMYINQDLNLLHLFWSTQFSPDSFSSATKYEFPMTATLILYRRVTCCPKVLCFRRFYLKYSNVIYSVNIACVGVNLCMYVIIVVFIPSKYRCSLSVTCRYIHVYM